MSVTVACLKESAPGERRVAITPETAKKLAALGARVLIERDAGASAGFPDASYADVAFDSADAVLAQADLLLCVQSPEAATLSRLKSGAAVVGMLAAHAPGEREAALSSRQEIYSQGMPALQALRQSLGALVGAPVLRIRELQDRVRGRYPDATPLPGRPELDRLLEEVGAPLKWSATAAQGSGAYLCASLMRPVTFESWLLLWTWCMGLLD